MCAQKSNAQPGRHPQRWHRLDNTANLFPVISSKRFSNVYRLSITLKEAIAPELLQQALETVLPRFAAFQVRMRRGLFWHYLEANPVLPLVYEEDGYPVTYIDPQQNRQYLFRLTYFENRINLEIFHVLTDGTGGMQFLQALVCRYLVLAHPTHFTPEERARRWFSQHATDTEDSYVANYTPTLKSDFNIGRGYKLTGERNVLDSLSVIHAYIPIKPLLALCRQKEVSVSHYLTAAIAWGLYETQLKRRPPRHPVNIFVPVNLRNLFPSTTALNFFSNIYVTLDYKGENLTFDALLAEAKRQYLEKATRENMLQKISYTVGSGYSPLVRMVPLPLKTLAMRIIYESSAKSSSMGLSNIGRVEMPDPFKPYVTGAGFLLSCAPREPFKCAFCSYEELLTLSFTSLLRDTAIQRTIVRHLAAQGLDITIESNGVDYESL